LNFRGGTASQVFMSIAASATAAGPADERPWVIVPSTPEQIEAAARQCRRLVRQRAALAAGVALVPLPGLDWVTDIGVLLRLLPRISEAFGLTEEQVERLTPERRVLVYRLVSAAGGVLLGRVLTRDVALMLLRKVGLRLGAQQVAKFVPLVGQAASALLTYGAMLYVCEQHIRDCVAVAEQLRVPQPQAVVR
jgi:uncharacterized protein (DUF697 family)